MNTREVALFVWERLLATPYRWGGDDPLAGLDCSGLVVEGLKSVGVLPREGDWTAHSLAHGAFQRYPRVTKLEPGVLVFWGDGSRLVHVEIVWRVLDNGTVLTIGASGGGSTTTNEEAAIQQNAYVKIRPIRRGWAEALDPFASSYTPQLA